MTEGGGEGGWCWLVFVGNVGNTFWVVSRACLVNKIISVSSDKHLLLMTPWQLCFVFSLVSHFLPTFVFPSINYASVLIKLNSTTGIFVITLTSRGGYFTQFSIKTMNRKRFKKKKSPAAPKKKKPKNDQNWHYLKSSGRRPKCPDSTTRVSTKIAGSSTKCRRLVDVFTVG